MEPASPDTEPAAPRLGKREGRSPRDMALSLAVLLVPIALLLAFYRVVLDGDKPVTVDPTAMIEQAGREFPVATPRSLGSDWHVVSATIQRKDGVTLRIGYVDPDAAPVLLVQSTVDPEALMRQEIGEDRKGVGVHRTQGRVWYRYTGRPDESALVVTESKRTLLIVGTASPASLERLAASLS